MATVVFTALGAAVGGPIGAAAGALIGQQVDHAILAPPGRQGPRLQDLTLATSSYGQPVPRHFGRLRTGGTIIWATDLRESSSTSGGGKGGPAVTTYSYAASFAVALSSRPLAGIGRIWADGNLLRGAAGDLKVGGQLRFHPGHGDARPDPLLAAAEGAASCPACRGLAYVVFEDLQLADFGNRIPALSFEVIGLEDEVSLAAVVADAVSDAQVTAGPEGVMGLSLGGPLAELLADLAPVVPFACDVSGAGLRLLGPAAAAVALPEPAVDPAAATGTGRSGQRAPGDAAAVGLRYYDAARDYQPGLQRAGGQPAAGTPRVIELPLTLSAATARGLIDRAAQRAQGARQRLAWRMAQIDPAVGPGSLVRVPGEPGLWQVDEWEWRAEGVMLGLSRIRSAGIAPATVAADSGRVVAPVDLGTGPTVVRAFELPWDGVQAGATAWVHLAVSSAAPGWTGAALHSDDGTGLQPLGGSGRTRCVMGQALDVLPAATSLLPDRASTVVVELLGDDLVLNEASARQLAMGANRALLGAEIIQFALAEPLGRRRWRLRGLLRGRGGTEAATGDHARGEGFVLIDDRLRLLDAARLPGQARVAAIGLADPEPVMAAIELRGLASCPPSPVHPRVRWRADGGLDLAWTRRARGVWTWPDRIDAPLNEEREVYDVLAGPDAAPLRRWSADVPALSLARAELEALRVAAPGAVLTVRQRGSLGLSAPLSLVRL